MRVSTSRERIIAEASKRTSPRTDRLSHFGHRTSLFLQTLDLRGISSSEQEHRLEEFYMKKILIQYAVCALAVALMVPLAQARSQPVIS